MQITKYSPDTALPAFLMGDESLLDINKEVVSQQAFPSMSIKGKVFTVNKDGVKTVLTKPGEDDEVAQSIGVVMVRVNTHAKTFYAKKFTEESSDGARPDCYSYDGIAPSANAQTPQSKKCAICPHNQWGSRTNEDGEAKGKSCQDNFRVAISTPDNIDPMLIRVPPKSRKALRDMLKEIAARKVPYNAVIVKIGFDRDEASPVLTFKPVGFLDKATFDNVRAVQDSEVVRAIVGLDDHGMGEPVERTAPSVDMDELDAAISAKAATKKAAAKPVTKAPEVTTPPDDDEDDTPPPAAKPAPKATKPAKVVAPPPDEDEDDTPPPAAKPEVKASTGGGLLADLDELLGNKDD